MKTSLTSERVPQLDGLRAIAFSAVYLNHALNVSFLWVGVDLFFVLSGYLITGLLLRESEYLRFGTLVQFFYIRRMFRILIPYGAVLVLVTVFVESHWLTFWPYYILFSQNIAVSFHGGQGVLNPLWSLAVEEQFYLLWPAVLFVCPRPRLGLLCGSLMGVALMLRMAAAIWAPDYLVTFTLTPFRMDLLAAGALIALVGRRPNGLFRWRRIWILMGSTAAVSFLTLAITQEAFRAKTNSLLFNAIGYSLVLVGCASALIVALTGTSGIVHRLLICPPIRYLGRISFMCYMAHEPILKLTDRLDGPLHAAVAFAAVIGFSSVTWYTFEERCIRLGRRLSSHPESKSNCRTTTVGYLEASKVSEA